LDKHTKEIEAIKDIVDDGIREQTKQNILNLMQEEVLDKMASVDLDSLSGSRTL